MQQIDANSFQKVFREMDDSALLGYPEVAAVLRVSPDFVSRIKSTLPQPRFDQHRFVRWTAGQIRAWLIDKEVAQAGAGAGEGGSTKRHGRPRKSVEIQKGGAA